MFLGNLVKKDSKLGYTNARDKLLYNLFLDKIKEGQEVEIFICLKGHKASPAQIAKVHASIREIAHELGYTFDEMKKLIKERAGLCYDMEEAGVKRNFCKSFADCSLVEIGLAIEACNSIAADNNINLG